MLRANRNKINKEIDLQKKLSENKCDKYAPSICLIWPLILMCCASAKMLNYEMNTLKAF